MRWNVPYLVLQDEGRCRTANASFSQLYEAQSEFLRFKKEVNRLGRQDQSLDIALITYGRAL